MRPLLFNASHIAAAPTSHKAMLFGRPVVARLYDTSAPTMVGRLRTRIVLAWEVFIGRYDVLRWEVDSPEALAAAVSYYSEFRSATIPLTQTGSWRA